MKLEYSGRRSSEPRTRHIEVRFFYIHDKVKSSEVIYYPTDSMLVDFLTKPLGGSKNRFFRKIIMGYLPLSALSENLITTSSKECVGRSG